MVSANRAAKQLRLSKFAGSPNAHGFFAVVVISGLFVFPGKRV
jgi:hypothetical protein